MEFQLVQRTWAPSAGLLSPLHLRRMVLPKAAASRGFGYRDLEVPNWGNPLAPLQPEAFRLPSLDLTCKLGPYCVSPAWAGR